MKLRKVLALTSAAAVAASVMSSFAFSSGFEVNYGSVSYSTECSYDDIVASGDYVFYDADGDGNIAINVASTSGEYFMTFNGDWSPATISAEGVDSDDNVVSSLHRVVDCNAGNNITIKTPYALSKYGLGLNLGIFDYTGDYIFLDKINLSKCKALFFMPSDGLSAEDFALDFTFSEVFSYTLDEETGDVILGEALSVSSVTPYSRNTSENYNALGLSTFELTDSMLTDDQKQLIREGAVARFEATFDKLVQNTVFKYRVNNGNANASLLYKNSEMLTLELTNDMIYSSATDISEESFGCTVDILDGFDVRTAKLVVEGYEEENPAISDTFNLPMENSITFEEGLVEGIGMRLDEGADNSILSVKNFNGSNALRINVQDAYSVPKLELNISKLVAQEDMDKIDRIVLEMTIVSKDGSTAPGWGGGAFGVSGGPDSNLAWNQESWTLEEYYNPVSATKQIQYVLNYDESFENGDTDAYAMLMRWATEVPYYMYIDNITFVDSDFKSIPITATYTGDYGDDIDIYIPLAETTGDKPFTRDFGTANQVTCYDYDANVYGAYYLPIGDVQLKVANPCNSWGWVYNGDWAPVTVSVEGYTSDGSVVSSSYLLDDLDSFSWDNGAVVTVPVTNTGDGSGLDVSAFETYADGVIITKISVLGASLCCHSGYDMNGEQMPVSSMPSASWALTKLTSSQILQFIPIGRTEAELGTSLESSYFSATSAVPMTQAYVNGMTTFDISNLSLKNSQKRIIREGATADLTITFDTVIEDTIFEYKINGEEFVRLLPENTSSITFKFTNDMLYKAAASEDDAEEFLGKLQIISGITPQQASVKITPAGYLNANSIYAGDANGDKSVNIRDVVLLFQYIYNNDLEMNTVLSDVNRDGSLNIRDVVLLFQYTSGWDVVLK